MATVLTTLLSNVGRLTRMERLEDRDYLVAPTVMMTEGVHAGNHGPILWLAEEMSKTPESWDHKPVVVYHPESNGQAISGCRPEVLQARKVGVILNTAYNNKLRTESWIDPEKAKKVDERVLNALNEGKIMEVSTGVTVDVEDKEGDWNGQHYVGIARNLRPDHLALLPDRIGACSVEKGAGLLQINEMSPAVAEEALKRTVFNALRGLGLNGGGMSHADVHSALYRAIRSKVESGGKNWDGWLEEVFDRFCIYSVGSQLYRIGYTPNSSGQVVLDGSAEEVTKRISYVTMQGVQINNQKPKENENMDRKQAVDKLIANNTAGWTEGDRDFLTSMKQPEFDRVAKMSTAAPPPNPTPVNNQNPAPTPAPNPNPNPAPQTLQDHLNSIQDPMLRRVLNNGVAAFQNEQKRLIDIIITNKKNKFSPEALAQMDLPELTNLAALAAPDEPLVPSLPANNGSFGLTNYALAPGGVPIQNAEGPAPLGSTSDRAKKA